MDADNRTLRSIIPGARSQFRNGGTNLPVCRDDRQVVGHLFGNYSWRSLESHSCFHPLIWLRPKTAPGPFALPAPEVSADCASISDCGP